MHIQYIAIYQLRSRQYTLQCRVTYQLITSQTSPLKYIEAYYCHVKAPSAFINLCRGSFLPHPSHNPPPLLLNSHHSPITYSHPSPPIQTSCSFPAGTSILAPTPNVSFFDRSSRGYVMVSVPRRMRWVVKPLWEWGG